MSQVDNSHISSLELLVKANIEKHASTEKNVEKYIWFYWRVKLIVYILERSLFSYKPIATKLNSAPSEKLM